MSKYLGILMMLVLVAGCARKPETAASAQEIFMRQFKPFCNKAYAGETIFPKKGDPFAGKPLAIYLEECDPRKVRINFRVGDDQSRTWVLTRNRQGLLLKHDHRKPDGSHEDVTMYGGLADDTGTGRSQSFPADAQTAGIIPAAKNNIWTVELDPEKNTLDYILKRDGTLRYQARFDLSKPVARP